jgi:predicted dehydrogenase
VALRVGVIGLGLGRIHAQAYDQNEAVGAVVLCDPDEARTQTIKESLGKVQATYPTLDAMLNAETLDAVSIVTPDHLHRAHAEAVFAAGCHVLLTKPLAPNLDDARAIIRCAESSGRKFMVAQEQRFHSREQHLKTLLDAGELGDVIHIRVDSFHYKAKQFKESPWYASSQGGRTAMVGTAIHEVDAIRYLTGKRIESVFAYGNTLGDLDFHGDKTVAALFQLEGGAIAQVTVTYVAWPGVKTEAFGLIGTRGMVSGNQVVREGHSETLPTDVRPLDTGTFACVNHFIDALVHDAPIAVTGRDAFASLAACAAADESARMGIAVVPASELFD